MAQIVSGNPQLNVAGPGHGSVDLPRLHTKRPHRGAGQLGGDPDRQLVWREDRQPRRPLAAEAAFGAHHGRLRKKQWRGKMHQMQNRALVLLVDTLNLTHDQSAPWRLQAARNATEAGSKLAQLLLSDVRIRFRHE